MELANHITAEGRRVAVVRLPSGELVVEADGERVGPIRGDCAGYCLEPAVVFAGVERERAAFVELRLDDGTILTAPVSDGAWLASAPFVAGMRVTVAWFSAAGEELREYAPGPLERRDLLPGEHAAWVGYAPL